MRIPTAPIAMALALLLLLITDLTPRDRLLLAAELLARGL